MPLRVVDRPPKTADLVIVGGGVIGAATAFHAAKSGLSPVLVEARPALATLTTPVSAGAFRLQFDDLGELELVRESVDLFLDFEERTGQREHPLGVRQQGYLWLATTEGTAARQRGLVDRLHGWGQTDVEVLDGDEVRRRFPYVGPEVVQARFRAGDGFVDTKRLTYGLAVGAGCPVVLDAKVTGLATDRSGLAAVRTTRGAILTRTAVVAAGPLIGPVAALAGLDLPVATVRRQKLWVPGLEVVPQDAPMTIDEETGAHWRPAFGGAWVLFTDPATPANEPAEVVPVDPAFAFRLLDPRSDVSVARVVPFWSDVWRDGAAHWLLQAGQYTMTPDHKPLIGPTAMDGLWVNGGYSGHGIMLGPAGGRIAADLLTGRLDRTANPFAPDRAFEARPATLL
jgi:sarcosine oxidase subunit beta